MLLSIYNTFFLFFSILISLGDALPRSKSRRDGATQYLLGVGKADITSGPVEFNFMGYASLGQVGTGIRQRIYSRAFIIGSTSQSKDKFVYVITDLQSGDTAIRKGVMEGLELLYPGVYGENVAVVGTHSHSSSGGFLNYLLPQITVLGLAREVFDPIVAGIIQSIKQAHESLAPGYLTLGKGRLEDANINRSLYAYLANPAAERALYGDDTVDKDMTVLGFEKSDGTKIGILTWFAVHGTSMYENNTLITGDNKGLAAYYFEQAHPGFVAGFSQANVGDTSPNTLGAFCEDTGLECVMKDSTCGGKNEPCRGRGPGFRISDTESCRIIGQKQADAAEQIYDAMYSGSGTPVTGDSVKWVHQYVDFGAPYTWTDNGVTKSTCKAAMGANFAAGTTDGPGQFDFKQGDSANPFWLAVGSFIHTPSPAQTACQAPKQILLDVGEMNLPYAWGPNIMENQLFRVGQLAFIIASGEATTMSGRRWRNAVSKGLTDQSILSSDVEPWVVLGGPANTYGHYITTPEEYDIQRYEGASTLHGRNTLDAYIHISLTNLQYLAANSSGLPATATGPLPPINTANSFNLNGPVLFDSPEDGKPYGTVKTQPAAEYAPGANASAVFIGANPRNNVRAGDTYLTVELLQGDGTWSVVKTDADWTTVMRWKRTNVVLGYSEVTLEWEIEQNVKPGMYRFGYRGDAKNFWTGKISGFTGTSNSFAVTGTLIREH